MVRMYACMHDTYIVSMRPAPVSGRGKPKNWGDQGSEIGV